MLLSPLIAFAMFSALLLRQQDFDFGPMSLSGGLALATFGGVLCLLSILPFALNQFAVDRAGLTLTLLSPISDRDLLIGKAVGNGLVAAVPGLACFVLAFAIFHDAPLVLWLNLVPAFVATYVASTPVAAALSAILPRSVNLNSIGRGSNAHGLAAVVGMVTILAAGLPALALTLLAVRLLHTPALALLLVSAWCALVVFASRLLFGVAARIFASRRENLSLVVRK